MTTTQSTSTPKTLETSNNANHRVLIGVLLLLSLTGCADHQPDPSAWRFESFHGHTWIVYERSSYGSNVIHDPDCKCGWAVGPSPLAGAK